MTTIAEEFKGLRKRVRKVTKELGERVDNVYLKELQDWTDEVYLKDLPGADGSYKPKKKMRA